MVHGNTRDKLITWQATDEPAPSPVVGLTNWGTVFVGPMKWSADFAAKASRLASGVWENVVSSPSRVRD